MFRITLHGLSVLSLLVTRPPWSCVPTGMMNTKERRDIYRTILFHTYGTLIHPLPLIPSTDTTGCKDIASTHALLAYSHMEMISHEEHIVNVDWLRICLIVDVVCDTRLQVWSGGGRTRVEMVAMKMEMEAARVGQGGWGWLCSGSSCGRLVDLLASTPL